MIVVGIFAVALVVVMACGIILLEHGEDMLAARRKRRELKDRVKLARSGVDPDYITFLEDKLNRELDE